jgi:hypothetical protein
VRAAVVAQLPALPLHTAGKYVAGAYIVLMAMVLLYVGIMSMRLGRIEQEVGEILEQLDAREQSEQAAGDGGEAR